MPLSDAAAVVAIKEMLRWRGAEKDRLDRIHNYLHGTQTHPVSPKGSPEDLKRMARISRVNMMKIVVNSVNQALFVDGFRQQRTAEDAPVWETWQANKMDRSQLGIHRASLAYGVSYVTVLPGDTGPVIRGLSPRRMTALYGDDEDWPLMALRVEPNDGGWFYRLYDEEAIYTAESGKETDDVVFVEVTEHNIGVTPVVRFLNEQDLDEDNEGEVEPLMALQDQVDLTTFSLLVAQHYAAFRQRYIIGWTAESENELVTAGAARILTFEDDPSQVQVGEFQQTQLEGYLKSREESLKQMASISQTPVHELIGSLVNLSAEALVAAEAGQHRKVQERQTSFGESWESVLELAGILTKKPIEQGAQVRWRDTEPRPLAAIVDALGKIASQLEVPVEELWERIPGVTQQDIQRWKQARAEEPPEPTPITNAPGADAAAA
jgi:hypothetical protein